MLILAVLGSILGGVATPTEAASVGAVGALVLAALRWRLSFSILRETAIATATITCMVFIILFGAAVFSIVFRLGSLVCLICVVRPIQKADQADQVA